MFGGLSQHLERELGGGLGEGGLGAEVEGAEPDLAFFLEHVFELDDIGVHLEDDIAEFFFQNDVL